MCVCVLIGVCVHAGSCVCVERVYVCACFWEDSGEDGRGRERREVVGRGCIVCLCVLCVCGEDERERMGEGGGEERLWEGGVLCVCVFWETVERMRGRERGEVVSRKCIVCVCVFLFVCFERLWRG